MIRLLAPGALLFVCLVLSGRSAVAQPLVAAREPVLVNLPLVDDIEVLPNGRLLASLPGLGVVVEVDSALNVRVVASGVIHGMALDPSATNLWVADFGAGTLRRIDIASAQVMETLSGFAHPLEIVFTSPTRMLVGTLATPDFQHGIGTIREVLLGPPGALPQVTPLATGFVGGFDCIQNSEGRLFATSLGSTALEEVLPGGVVVPVGGPVLQGADLVPGPGASFYACTILVGEIIRFDPTVAPAARIPVAALVAGSIGPGCEDLAFDLGGNLIVAMNNGEIWRVRVADELVQEGLAYPGIPFNLVLSVPPFAGRNAAIAASFAASPPTVVAGTNFTLWLQPDALFAATVDPLATPLSGSFGTLDLDGRMVASVSIPLLPPGPSIPVYAQAVVHQSGQIAHLTNAVRIEIIR